MSLTWLKDSPPCVFGKKFDTTFVKCKRVAKKAYVARVVGAWKSLASDKSN